MGKGIYEIKSGCQYAPKRVRISFFQRRESLVVRRNTDFDLRGISQGGLMFL